MIDHDSLSIYDQALNTLSGLAPQAIPPNPAQLIIHGHGSTLESLVVVNLILALEEELSSRQNLKIDLVKFLAQLKQPVTLGQYAREVEARIAKA